MKVAVVGAGFGRYAMAPVYEKLGFQVEVATPRDPEAVARALAAKPDLVSVHSPPFMHHDHVMRALDRGCAVLCDKPFGRNAAEARAMRDRAREAGVPPSASGWACWPAKATRPTSSRRRPARRMSRR